jgi:predicted permease
MRAFLRRLLRALRRDRHAADLEEEMRFHLAMRAESLVREGHTPEAARRTARRLFGNPASHLDQSHDGWGFGSLDQWRQDVRLAVRRLARRRALSVPIVLVLALGIGATTAVFSAVDASLLRPLPFVRPNELVTLTSVNVPFEATYGQSRLINIEDVWSMPATFNDAAAFASGGLNLDDPANPQRVKAGVVTWTFFETLGVLPARGRAFAREDGTPTSPRVTVLSHALWQRQFGGRDVLGSTVTLHGNPYLVVGVMPRGFGFPQECDLWIPMSVPTTFETFAPFRGWLPSRVVARLAPGVSREAAAAQLLARWEQSLVGADPRSSLTEWVAEVRARGAASPLHQTLVGDRRRALGILMGATVLLLLIACANVANLLLTDAAQRGREVALRQVLGATRRRIARQLLVESVLLSLTGAALGLALAPPTLAMLRATLPSDLAGLSPAQLDLRVLAFAAGLAIVTGLVFGAWPARSAAALSPVQAIKAGSGHGATAADAGRARRVLIGAELALTVMLLIGAGLMMRSFSLVVSQPMGFRPDSVGTLELTFARGGSTRAERLRVVDAVLERLRASPGIKAAGVINDLPLRGGSGISLLFRADGTPPPRTREEIPWARRLISDAGYFSAMGIPLVRGRLFTPADDSLARVVIISAGAAHRYWKDADPVGRTFRFTGDTVRHTVIGVVGDVRENTLEAEPDPQMYFPVAAGAPENIALVVRTSGSPAAALARLREAVSSVAPYQAVYNVRAMDDVVGQSVAPRRTSTVLMAVFAGVGLAVAALGVYAVVAYGVARRTREFGIRCALGASGMRIALLVSGEFAAVAGVGVTAGLAGAWSLSRVLAALLYRVDVHDQVAFVVAPLVLLVSAAAATIVPALRAARVNPAELIRVD